MNLLSPSSAAPALPMRPRLSARLPLEDEFGERVAALLAAGTRSEGLPHDIGERLRTARLHALARRKVANVRARTAAALFGQGGTATATLGGGNGRPEPRWWSALATALPIAAIVAGLFLIQRTQLDDHVRELAATDAAMLADELPPTAYADPGFVEFLNRSQRAER